MQSSRLQKKSSSLVTLGNSEENRLALKVMYEIVLSCFGPSGSTKMIQNSVGGPLIVTSSSTRLLSSLSISNPVLKLAVNAAKSHLYKCEDHGLSVLIVIFNLVLHSYELEIERFCLVNLFEIFLEELLKYLSNTSSTPDYFPVTKLQFSDLNSLKALTSTILTSKPSCHLKPMEVEHISTVLIKSFLISVPEKTGSKYCKGKTIFVTHANNSVFESKVFSGIYLTSPEFSCFHEEKIHYDKIMFQGNILVALVTVSMSGDSEELGDLVFETVVDNYASENESILLLMEDFCKKLKRQHVGLLICQKVIHPRIKRFLREESILFVERTGLQMVGYVQDITGAAPITQFHCVDDTFLGSLDSLQHNIVNNQSYLHMDRRGYALSTVIICCPQEEKLEELKVLCNSTLAALNMMLEDPRVLLGGGCWQFVSAVYVKNKIKEISVSISSDTGLNKLLIEKACDVFCNSLLALSFGNDKAEKDFYTCSAIPHIWKIDKHQASPDETLTCGCGLFRKSLTDLQLINFWDIKSLGEEVNISPVSINFNIPVDSTFKLDSFNDCISALKSSLHATNIILSIGQYIVDEN